MNRSNGAPSEQRKLGPVGWVSLCILLVGSASLLYYISGADFSASDPVTDGGTVHTAQSSPANPSAGSPEPSSPSPTSSTSARANYTSVEQTSPSTDENAGSNRSGSSSSSGSESTESTSSRADQSFPDNYTRAKRLVNIFHGESAGRTPTFEVSDVWTIEWEARGSMFQAFVFDESGDLHKIAVNRSGMGQGGQSGEVELETPGTYRLKVNALSTWRVRIVQGE